MNEFNTYPVFVADQVLTAAHLNQVRNYLDEQDRLTRNKLIGIGIVCGLDINATDKQIEISKGCGITSEGYLILHDHNIYTHYRPYVLPDFFAPEYKPVYQDWHMWELLTTERSLDFEDESSIAGDAAFMKDKIVVLLLEMKEKPLKNCIELDCEDKGDKVEFNLKPLLVLKADIDKFIQSHEGDSDAEIEGGLKLTRLNIGSRRFNLPSRKLKIADEVNRLKRFNFSFDKFTSNVEEFRLKRFNVPFSQLKNTDDVFQSFLQITGESTLKQLAETLNYCYFQYQPVLDLRNNPFENIFNTFKNRLSYIKAANPFFIQYFYDWLDDIVKAYNEFEEHIFDVQLTCCPDEDLFPLHLMLGEANKNTSDIIKSEYRNYFIYSPLFNEQKNRLAEAKLLFERLQKITEYFNIPDIKELFKADVKVTPSKYLDKPLSDRCIPYYYNALELYPVWSWQKTRRGKAKSNLSYNASEYSNVDQVIHPLLYDIEAYSFFRIEGHVGKPFTQALSTVINQRDHFNLPFDIVALSTASISRFFEAKDHECHFKDLESLYEVLLAEMKCKFGEFECMAAKIPYKTRFVAVTNTEEFAVTGLADNTIREVDQPEEDSFGLMRRATDRTIRTTEGTSGHIVARRTSDFSNIESLVSGRASGFKTATIGYQLGDFLRNHCKVLKGSVGEVYLNAIGKNVSFNRATAFEASTNRTKSIIARSNFNINTIYFYLFHFIHSLEQTFQIVLDEDLEGFEPELFNAKYEELIDAVGDLARVGETLDDIDPENEQMKAILDNLKTIGFYDLSIQIHTLLHVCMDDKLQALKNEYKKRVKELRLLTNLMHYSQKHAGMEHKAGVPKGGTFILVYHETPSRRKVFELSKSNRFTVSLAARERTAFRAAENTPLAIRGSEIGDSVKESYVRDPKLLRKFEKSLNRFMDTCNDMDEVEKEKIRDILTKIPRETEPLKFRVPEEAVIADFYLPYSCCSDCTPISYVVPKVPEEILNIGIKPTEFCNDDTRIYPLSVSPKGGELTASNGGLTEENGFLFSPKGLEAGVNKLTYILADGRSTSIDLLINEAFEVGFKFKDLGEATIQFLPDFEQADREILWDFGDGKTSEEFSPKHSYSFDDGETEFVVKLTVTNSPCVAAAEQTITVKKAIAPEFDLLPRIFCVNDRKEYDLTIQPFPEKVTEIVNNDKLLIDFDAANKKIVFVPTKHRIQSSKDFHLEYKGLGLDVRVVVADAAFIMNIESVGDGGLNPNRRLMTHRAVRVDDFKISLGAKQSDATNYSWKVTQGDINKGFNRQKVEFSMTELGMKPGSDIVISLTLNHQLPSGNCRDEKKITITRTIFAKHVDKGEFDNNTTG